MNRTAMAVARAHVGIAAMLFAAFAAAGCASDTSSPQRTETPLPGAEDPLNDPRQVIESVARGITHNLRNQPDLQTATARRMTAAEAADEITKLGGNGDRGILASRLTEAVWLVRFNGSFVGTGQNVLYEPAKGTFVTVIGVTSGAELYSETIYDDPTPTPAECGSWGSQDSPIAEKYGEITDCGFFAGYWVITTFGQKLADGSQASGTIALYFCEPGDSTCEDGNSDPPLSGWSFVSPPYEGGVTILERRARNMLVVSNGGHQLVFDLSIRQFIDDKPIASP